MVEELKGLLLQLETDNDEMRAAVRAICLTRPEKSKADLARIEAAVNELDKIRDRNAPSSSK